MQIVMIHPPKVFIDELSDPVSINKFTNTPRLGLEVIDNGNGTYTCNNTTDESCINGVCPVR